MSEIREKCGVTAVYTKGEPAARIAYFALSALQHRGQESSGIVTSDDDQFFSHRGPGLVAQVYREKDLRKLTGEFAIGHNRYATSGGKHDSHIQPVLRSDDILALAHNGNLPSVEKLKHFLKSKNIYKAGSNDSEMMTDAIRYYIYHGKTITDAIKLSWPLFTGVFSCTLLTQNAIYAFRDRCGVRPLSLGKLKNGYIVASETCAFDMVGAKHARDVKPGELIKIDSKGIKSWQIEKPDPKLEVFEFIYFARPDSVLGGKLVNEIRRKMGDQLAIEHPKKVDLVVPVPDSAIPAALGYAYTLGIEFDHVLIKNRYIHRTFIQPTQELRERAVQMKLNPLPEHIRDKSIVLVDDSIVRGTTTKQIVKILRKAGAKEVHIRVSSPPVRFPDFYGIDTPDQSQLIASKHNLEDIQVHVQADSLAYLSYDGMIKAIGIDESKLCTACFTGNYPIDLMERASEVVFDYPKSPSAESAQNLYTQTTKLPQ